MFDRGNAGHAAGISRRLTALITGALLALAVAPAGVEGGSAQAAACPPQPKALSPRGAAPARFTMLIRVNKPRNAGQYASPDEAAGGLATRIRPRDVFVVNTRFRGSSPAEWRRIVAILRGGFPCNRIVALNGMGGDPSAPGYAYALLGVRAIWASLTDWEPDDWRVGRASNPFLAPWTGHFPRTRKRARRWVGRMTGLFGASAATRWRRAGLVPQQRRKWDYGLLAREISAPHRRLAPGRRGIESVQTQDSCAFGGPRAMAAAVHGLRRQYKRANFKRVRVRSPRGDRGRIRHRRRKWRTQPSNLGVQVSFTQSPDPAAGMAILRTAPEVAAWCTRAALKRGAGAILYWASPDSMRALLATPEICAMRPSPRGAC